MGSQPMAIFSVYAPTQARADEDPQLTEDFYRRLIAAIKALPSFYAENFYILGDFNARVGIDLEGWSTVRGDKLEKKEWNKNGVELLLFCQQLSLMIANSFFDSPVPFTFRCPGKTDEGFATHTQSTKLCNQPRIHFIRSSLSIVGT